MMGSGGVRWVGWRGPELRVRKVKAPNEVPLANYVKGRKSMLLKCIRRQGVTKGNVGSST